MRLYPLYLIAISLCIGCGSTDPISSVPEGSDFYLTEVSGEEGIKAVSSVCNGKRTIAAVNVTDEAHTIKITSEGFEDMTFSPASEETLTLDPESLVVISEL